MLFEPSSRGGTLQSEPFEYMATGESVDGSGAIGQNSWSPGAAMAKSKAERAEVEAYERGLREGETRVSRTFQEKAAVIQSSVLNAINSFRKEREEYFNRIEPEVVQLSLAISKKILHREAQIDPLLLTGLVHVALEKVGAGTRVRLRANPADIHFWNEYFARSNEGGNPPDLIGDVSLQPGECALETEVGSTQVSLDTQLKEIEQGFFDLLEQRPRVR